MSLEIEKKKEEEEEEEENTLRGGSPRVPVVPTLDVNLGPAQVLVVLVAAAVPAKVKTSSSRASKRICGLYPYPYPLSHKLNSDPLLSIWTWNPRWCFRRIPILGP
jgi:hypothetical protein